MSKYFSESEFKKCVPSCSERDMDGAFLSLLDEVRKKAGIPLVLNCAYRSSSWDKSKGRSRKPYSAFFTEKWAEKLGAKYKY